VDPRSAQRICCRLTNRLLTIWLTADSVNRISQRTQFPLHHRLRHHDRMAPLRLMCSWITGDRRALSNWLFFVICPDST